MDAGLRARKLEAIDELEEAGTSGLQGLVVFLDDPDPAVRQSAAASISKLRDQSGAEPLLRHLDDPDSVVRAEVAEGLGILEYRPAAQRLVETLRRDPDLLVRVCAAEALGYVGVKSPSVVEELVRAMGADRHHLVRAYAAESLGLLRVQEARGLIWRRVARERSLRARASMLAALSMLGEDDAFRLLLDALRTARSFVLRTAILNALRELATPENAAAIQQTVEEIAGRNPTFATEHRWFFTFLQELRSAQTGR